MSQKKSSIKEGGDVSDTLEAVSADVDDIKLNALREYYKMPEPVKRRVRALKKLLHETIKIDAELYKKMFDLEKQYEAQHQSIFDKRTEIINGSKEPNDDECDWPTDDESIMEKIAENVKQVTLSAGATSEVQPASDAGIPEFWLTAMKNVPIVRDMIKEHDESILKHLTDIKCLMNTGEEAGFTLEFHFSSNPYFTDTVLKKHYYFNYEPSQDDPFSFEGPAMVRAKGCVIHWNPGKNVTVRFIKKRQRHNARGAKRTITKSVQEDSFFNFFQPPLETISDNLDTDTEMLLEEDFKIGQYFRECLVPRAVLHFTGEAVDSEFDEDEDDDDDYEDGDDDDDDDEEESPRRQTTGKHHGGRRTNDHNATGEQTECKTQ